MPLKSIALVSLVALAAAIGWRLNNTGFFAGLLHNPGPRAVNIPFDNGTVRQYDDAASAVVRLAKPTAPAAAPATTGLGRSTLHQVLDLSDPASLRDQRVERGVNPPAQPAR